jgi:hypothetical protein
MKIIIVLLMSFTLIGCTDYTPATPKDMKIAEMVCVDNGGATSVVVFVDAVNTKTRQRTVRCTNGITIRIYTNEKYEFTNKLNN